MRPRTLALVQLVVVVAAILGWLFSGLDARLLASRVDPVVLIVVHVGITGALATLLCVIASWREPSRTRALGLVRVPFQQAVLWGLIGVMASYAVATVGALVYFGVRLLAPHEAHAAMIDPSILTQDLPKDGVLGKELANKAEWAAELGKIPLALALPLALFAGLYEEVVFRGFVLGRLRIVFGPGKWPTIAAVVVSSALFAAGHGYQGGLGLVQTFGAGLTLAALAAYRGSIWPSVIAHALIDTFGLAALHLLRPILEQLKQHAT